MIREAEVVYYPTETLVPQLAAMGKRSVSTLSLACHLLEGDKIKQTTLFKLWGLPHPRTRVFYGRQRREITQRFAFPFVAKKPRASSRGRGVYLIENQTQLDAYLAKNKVAYIQERLPISRDIRVVVIRF